MLFVSGAVTMGLAVASLFFARFWTRTRDRLFLIFAVAFALLAVNQALAALVDFGREELSWVYLLRLAAFGLIIFGIVLIAIGLLWPVISKLGLGRLPGDIVIERENIRLYVPIMTSLIISVVLSLLLWFFNR